MLIMLENLNLNKEKDEYLKVFVSENFNNFLIFFGKIGLYLREFFY